MQRRILLLICGGIGAYKALELIRLLRENDYSIIVALSAAAKNFVTPLSLAALSGNKVFEDLFSLTDETAMGHIELSRQADLIVVVPASADLLAKAALGQANDLISTILLATDKKVLFAPAMNLRMWLHPATQRNVVRLKADGALFVGPENGAMACGEFGPGRLAEPHTILTLVQTLMAGDTTLGSGVSAEVQVPSLRGKHFVITSGPTHEPIDPVRYLANRSSGKQGHAIAAAAAAAGARVTLISGPVHLADPPDVKTIRVETARQMLAAVEQSLPADVFFAVAAVADWRLAEASEQKLKKDKSQTPQISLVENPDILKTVAQHSSRRPRLVVGFAAETENLEKNGEEKLHSKGCDLIVANDVRIESKVFGGEYNQITLISSHGVERWPKLDKITLAQRLIAHIASILE